MAAAARATAGYGTLQRVVVQERVIERYALIGCSSDEQSASAVCEEWDGTAAGQVRGVFVSTDYLKKSGKRCEPL